MSAGPYAGVGLALLATTSYNVGLVLEKRALERMPALQVRRVVQMFVSLATEPAWLAGFGLMLTGLACQIVVLTFEPVSVVQPVLASGIALVLLLSRLVLRERLGRVELSCAAAMAVSVILLALSSGGTGAGAGHSASSAWLAVVIVPSFALGLLIAAFPLRARARKHRAPVMGICYGLGTGMLYGVAALAIKALSSVLVRDHTAAGIATGLLSSPYLYVLAVCSVAAMALFQVALQSCRASIVVPASSVASSAYFLIAGTWLFHEHLPATPGKLGLRLAGIAVAGFVLIALARQAPAGRAAGPARGGIITEPRYLAELRKQSWP